MAPPSNNQLVDCRLLIVSDIVHLSPTTLELLKQILGRDEVSTRKMYNTNQFGISPNMLVVMVSNKRFEDFPVFQKDPAFEQKMLRYVFNADDSIDSEDQIANLDSLMGVYLSELMNWALHVPKDILHTQIRALEITEYQRARRGDVSAQESFLQEIFWEDPRAFSDINQIAAVREKYIAQSGNDAMLGFAKQEKRELGEKTCASLSVIFDIQASYTRATTKVDGYRPYGIRGVRLKGSPNEKELEGCKALERKKRGTLLTLPGVRVASVDIQWFSQEVSEIDVKAQNIIRKRDEKRLARLRDAS